MTIYFITGIDTDIGKTFATGLIARSFLQQGKKVITQKLVQTGQSGSISEDILTHRRLMGIDLLPEDSTQLESDQAGTLTCPYLFSYPASPHLAAQLENQTIMPEILTTSAETLHRQYDVLLIEGAGGFLVPLTPVLLTADYIADRQYPIILVTSGKLGSINHTLLTIEAIRHRHLSLACLAVNQYLPEKVIISDETLRYFQRICPNVITLPSVKDAAMLEADFRVYL